MTGSAPSLFDNESCVYQMIRIAFIGAGDVANRHAEAVAACENAELSGLFTIDSAQAKEKAGAFGCRVYSSAEEVMADKSVDAVFVLTNLETHHHFSSLALHSGKHVLVEKPVACTVKDLKDLRDTATTRGLVCMPGHNYIYEPGVIRMRDMLQEGNLGRLVSIYFMYNIAHPEHVAKKYPGVIQQILTHHAYTLLFLAGRPLRLSAMKATLHYETIPQEDIAMVNLQLEDGALAHFCASFAADDHTSDPWTVIIKVLGTEGGVRYNYRDWVEYRPGEVHSHVYTGYHKSMENEVDHFVNQCIAKSKPPLSSLEDAMVAFAMVAAAEQSAAEGLTVSL